MSGPVLSIVIVNWNTREMLDQCLASVASQTLISHEVWVVDNFSSDGSPAMVRAKYPDVHLIANSDNKGFAAANNQAIPLCSGEYVLLLNSDTLVLEGALDKMVAHMHAHPNVGALGCTLLNTDGTLQPSAHQFYGTLRSLVDNRLTQSLYPYRHAHTPWLGFWDHTQVRRVDWVCGAVLMVKREVLRDVGLLDDAFFMYGEEIDWQMRMAKAGHEVWFMPQARITHHGGGSSRQAVTKMKSMEYENRERFVNKHYSPFERAVYRTKTKAGRAFWQTLGRLRHQPVQVN